MEPLKDREKKILDYMTRFFEEHRYPPTVREICTALGIKSTSTAHKELAALEKKGYLVKDPSKPRALKIKNVQDEDINSVVDAMEEFREEIIQVPIVGRVAAGMPILAEENIEGVFPIPARFIRGESFMLRVKGESMIEAGIYDGDYILVRRQETANNGDIVVALVDGFETEGTVKTFYRENGHIRLQPENSSMSPIILEDVRIAGLVKGIFRYF